LALSDSALACPAVTFSGRYFALGSPLPGNSGFGIDSACVKGRVNATLEQAKVLLQDDRNLDWLAGALALNSNCILDHQYSNYCDYGDFVHRNAFVAATLAQLKSGPRMVHFGSTTKILFGSDEVKLAELEAASASHSTEQIIYGEYRVMRINPNQLEYSEKEVVKHRNEEVAVMYPRASTENDYAFATQEMQEKCNQMGGALETQSSEGPGAPHVGVLNMGLDRLVYYLGSCKTPSAI
jgi:hypothetical protein